MLSMQSLLVLLLLTLAHAHLTTVCTSTASSQCSDARVVFWLGTYHPPTCEGVGCSHGSQHWAASSGVPSGHVIVTRPDGISERFNFTSRCPVDASPLPGQCPGPNLMAHCQGPDLPTDAVVQCFTYNPSSGRTTPVADTCEAMAGVHPYDRVLTMYKAVVTQPISGL